MIKPSNIVDIYTRLERLPGIKISGHTDTLTEASNKPMNCTREVKYKLKSNFEMLLINFKHNEWNFQVK